MIFEILASPGSLLVSPSLYRRPWRKAAGQRFIAPFRFRFRLVSASVCVGNRPRGARSQGGNS